VSKWHNHQCIRLIAIALSGIIAFSSLLSIFPVRADAATIFIKNTANVRFTDSLGETYPVATDTAALNVLNVPVFRSVTKLGDPFSPNSDSRADTLYLSYTLYDHDYSQDTVGFFIYSGTDIVRTFVNNIAQETGYYSYAWDGRSDTGGILADGIYSYLLTALNADGNTTTVSGTITLDITPPTGNVFINNNAAYTNTFVVIVNLPAQDNLSGVDTVVISNTSSFALAETLPYATKSLWALSTDTETLKTVYVKYYDRAWNVSGIYQDTIILDLLPPKVIFTSPANGETDVPKTAVITAVFDDIMDTSTINTTSFVLRNRRGEAISGTVLTQLFNDTTSATFVPAYLRSNETYTVTITTTVRDKANNPMASPKVWYFTTIMYDITPPTGTLLINTGALYTNTTTVFLNLKAYDAQSPVTRMYISNSTFGNAIPFDYSETLTWTLDTTEGVKKVSAWFEDDAGNISLPYSDTITLDMTPPSVLWTSPAESEVNVMVNTSITIAFNDILNTGTLNTSTFVITDSLGNTIPAAITYEAFVNTSVVAVKPRFNLTSYETYTVTITTNVKDKSGLAMAVLKSWFFVTGDVMPPAAVEVLRAVPLSDTAVQINWRQVAKNMDGTPYTDARGYAILRSTVSGGPYTKLGWVNATDTAYIDTTITRGTTYYYIVRAQDTTGNSSPYWIEVTNEGNLIIRIPRDNSRGRNEEIHLNIGTQGISVRYPDINDLLTRIYIPKDAASVLYNNTNPYDDDLGIYILRSSQEEGRKTRNLGTIVSCYEGLPYKVTDVQAVPEIKFPTKVVITMKYEVEGGFIKHTSIPAALASRNLSISYWNGIQWVRLGGVVDITRQTISVATDFTGKFAITALDVSKFTVLSAEPNPFTPHRAPFDKVVFSLVNPDNERVTLRIYDITGTLVYEKEYPAGTVSLEWKGIDRAGRFAEDGVYIYQVQAGEKSYTGTVILAK